MAFSQQLSIAIKNSSLSRKEIANQLGISVSTLSGYETGYSFPRQDILFKIFNVLDITPNFLFNNETQYENKQVTIEEAQLVDNFRKLDTLSKQIILHVINLELTRK